MRKERIFILGILVLFSLTFISAILTHGNGGGATVSINNNNNNTYYINGSNINASSIICGGTDKFSAYNNNTGVFICSTDQNTASEILWSANYSLYNSSWSSIFNQTYQDAWLFTINNSFYPYTSNPFGYLNSSADSFAGNYTNFSNIYAYIVNGTFYLASNPNSYITLNQYFSNATQQFYPLGSNPYSYLNTTTETNWNANYSTFLTHITWGQAINGTLALNSNLQNGSYLNVPETDSLAYNGTLAYFSTLMNGSFLNIDYNSTGLIRNWNNTFLIRDWNNTGLIKNWASASEVDPFFSANLTAHNSRKSVV